MSETDNKPTLGRKPLGLKRSVEAGEVKQTFSHGRTNKVVVEVKKKRVIGKPGEGGVEAAQAPQAAPAPQAAAPARPAPQPAPRKPTFIPGETPQERVARLQREAEEARLAVLEETTRREQEEKLRAIEEEKQRAEKPIAAPRKRPSRPARPLKPLAGAEAAAPAAEPVAEPVVEASAEPAVAPV